MAIDGAPATRTSGFEGKSVSRPARVHTLVVRMCSLDRRLPAAAWLTSLVSPFSITRRRSNGAGDPATGRDHGFAPEAVLVQQRLLRAMDMVEQRLADVVLESAGKVSETTSLRELVLYARSTGLWDHDAVNDWVEILGVRREILCNTLWQPPVDWLEKFVGQAQRLLRGLDDAARVLVDRRPELMQIDHDMMHRAVDELAR